MTDTNTVIKSLINGLYTLTTVPTWRSTQLTESRFYTKYVISETSFPVNLLA